MPWLGTTGHMAGKRQAFSAGGYLFVSQPSCVTGEAQRALASRADGQGCALRCGLTQEVALVWGWSSLDLLLSS